MTWQEEMKAGVRDLPSLLAQLGLPEAGTVTKGEQQFPVFAPASYLSRIEPGNPDDPLLRQVLPLAAEDRSPSHFSKDPLGESSATLRPGLIQKYRGRVLLIATGACAIHCRYCFRRHFPYQQTPVSTADWEPAIERIHDDPSIREVILSGGDPLTLVDPKLQQLISRLQSIPHLRRLRIHTRLPIVIPRRITAELVQLLSATSLQVWFVLHCNHGNEIDAPVSDAIGALRQVGIQVLNQSVLLRGVNDDPATLIQLSEKLLMSGVLPYYLHQLDPVQGVSHFHVPVATGRQLIDEMRAELPGYAVPRYVQEIAGRPGKVVLA